MAVVANHKSDESDALGDITSNLDSLQFENALSEGGKDIINLRQRSHAHTVTACAQATYYVAVVNEARLIQAQLQNPSRPRATRIIQDSSTKEATRVAIIGCGRLGAHLANCLLSFAEVSPRELFISTRRPETLVDLQQKGVTCISSNADVAAKAHVLFLCVLPSQFPAVAEDIKGRIPKDCIVYSLMSAVPLPRIKQLTGTNNIVRPEFDWVDLREKIRWDNTMEVTKVFAHRPVLEKTCPLSFHKSESVIRTHEKLAEQMIYALVNMCTKLEVNRVDTVDILNAVVLGYTNSKTQEESFLREDITKYCQNNQFFPEFDLSTTLNRDTPITKKLVHNSCVRQAFVDRYCFIFQQYLEWRNTALAQARKQLTL